MQRLTLPLLLPMPSTSPETTATPTRPPTPLVPTPLAIESGRFAADLAGTPLWPDGAPRWAKEAWRKFKSALLAAGQDWNVWTDWYELRLAGDASDPPNEVLEVARAMIPDEIWKQNPAAVNAEIRRLIDNWARQEIGLLKELDDDAVDFSNRGQVKRWLDKIKPARRRREVATALAARAALRVLPLPGRELSHRTRERDAILSAVTLPCFRATALTWAAGEYPTHGAEVSAFADTAVAADRAAEDTARNGRVAAYASAYAARTAAYAAATAFAGRTADAARAGTYAVEDGNYGDFVPDFAIYDAAAADAALVNSGCTSVELAGSPLWPRRAPAWASEAWRTLKSALLATDEGWEVWTDWYDSRLAGGAAHPPNEELEIARATIPDEIWKRVRRSERRDQAADRSTHYEVVALNVLGLLHQLREGRRKLGARGRRRSRRFGLFHSRAIQGLPGRR